MLSVESVTQLDTSGIQALDEIHSQLKAQGIQLLVPRPKLYMRRYGESTGIGLRVGRENVFPSVRAAAEAILAREGAAMGSRPKRCRMGPSARFSTASGAVSNRRAQVTTVDWRHRRRST
ncbi:MAG: STAS domain-containing protein [Gammaproteobacteria bacterium]